MVKFTLNAGLKKVDAIIRFKYMGAKMVALLEHEHSAARESKYTKNSIHKCYHVTLLKGTVIQIHRMSIAPSLQMLWQLCYNELRVDDYRTKKTTKNIATNVDMLTTFDTNLKHCQKKRWSRDFRNILE